MGTNNFRGIRVDGGGWVYGVLTQAGFSYYIKERHVNWFVEVIPDTVGMFSGLFDDNGKAIYDGDTDVYGNVIRVSFGRFTFNEDRTINSSFEITGNIHESNA